MNEKMSKRRIQIRDLQKQEIEEKEEKMMMKKKIRKRVAQTACESNLDMKTMP